MIIDRLRPIKPQFKLLLLISLPSEIFGCGGFRFEINEESFRNRFIRSLRTFLNIEPNHSIILKRSLSISYHMRFVSLSVILFSAIGWTIAEANPFDSDVIELTSSNWKEVKASSQGWFINFCREG